LDALTEMETLISRTDTFSGTENTIHSTIEYFHQHRAPFRILLDEPSDADSAVTRNATNPRVPPKARRVERRPERPKAKRIIHARPKVNNADNTSNPAQPTFDTLVTQDSLHEMKEQHLSAPRSHHMGECLGSARSPGAATRVESQN